MYDVALFLLNGFLMLSRTSFLSFFLVLVLLLAGVLASEKFVRSFLFPPAAQKTSGLADIPFAEHKALYDIRLISTRSGSQIANISGQMFYEAQKSCEAWNVNNRFGLFYEYADSAPMRVNSEFSTFEPFDGRSLSFASRRQRDDSPSEILRGRAVLELLDNEAAASGGYVSFSRPEGEGFDLPAGTIFPVEHTRALLEKIEQGELFYSALVFDGSDEEGLVEINAFIGDEVSAPDFSGQENIDKSLLSSTAYEVRLAFFPLDNQESVPDYEMTFILHKNGVVSDMVIEYDDFTVHQVLKALEVIKGGCVREQEG